MVDNSQLTKSLSVFDCSNEAWYILIERVCTLTADSALQDDVHEVSIVTLAENNLLSVNLDKLSVLVDLPAHVRFVSFNEPQMTH